MTQSLRIQKRDPLLRCIARRLVQVVLIINVLLLPVFARASNLNYASIPLFWATQVPPNIVMFLDNSGSMANLSFSQDYSNWTSADVTTYAYKNYAASWYLCTAWNSSQNVCSSVNTTPITQLVDNTYGDNEDIPKNHFNSVSSGGRVGTGTAVIQCNVNTGAYVSSGGNGIMVSNSATLTPASSTSTTTTTYTTTYTFNAQTDVGFSRILLQTATVSPAGISPHVLKSGDNVVYSIGSCSPALPGSTGLFGTFGGLTNGTTYTIGRARGNPPNQNITLQPAGGGGNISFQKGSNCNQTLTYTQSVTTPGGGGGNVLLPGSDPQLRVVNACVRIREGNTARSSSTPPYESTAIPISTGNSTTISPSVTQDGSTSSDTWITAPYLQFLLNEAFLPAALYTASGTATSINNSGLRFDMFNTVPPPGTPNVSTGATAYAPVPMEERTQTVREVVLQTMGDNFKVANFGITTFNSSSSGGQQQVPSGSIVSSFGNTTSGQWYNLEHYLLTGYTSTTATPLAAALNTIIGNYVSGAEPMQYRCQKNFVVIMTDGQPTSDYTSSTYDQDHVPDNIFNGDGYLDDIAEKGYYIDLKTTGNDNAGVSWNDPSFGNQNIVTYDIAIGGAINDLLRMTPAVNRITIPSTAVTLQNLARTDVGKNGYLYYANHGLNNGDVVVYEVIDRNSGSVTAPVYLSPVANRLVGIVGAGSSANTLPSHLADAENNTEGLYYAVRVNNDEFALAASYDDAVANPPVTIAITGAGSGNHTFSTGPGHSYASTSARELGLSLAAALAQIRALTSSAAAVAANSSSLNSSTRIYQASFDTSGWTGDLFAYPVDPTTGAVNFNVFDWEIQQTITTGNVGTLLTWNPTSNSGQGAGTNFSANSASLSTNFSPAQLAALGANTAQQQDVINWVSGQTNLTTFTSGLGMRDRPVTIVGDILDSNPVYLGPTDYGYGVISGSVGTSYKSFLSTTATRRQMIFWGGNDGMLHGIDAATGRQLLGYVPLGVYMDFVDANNNGVYDSGETYSNKLFNLSQDSYGLTTSNPHVYFVDSTPTISDAQFSDGSWHTVLVGGLGAGGRSIYALDVTNTSSFSSNNVLWEFTDPRLGYSFSQPIVVRLQTGQFAAVFGNGFDSKNDVPRLFIVLLDRQGNSFIEGTNFWVMENSVSTYSPNASPLSNGVSGVVALLDANKTVLAVYGGDIQGNVWKFEMYGTPSSSAVPGWQISFGNTPFFTAWDDKTPANRQPIQSPPVIAYNSAGMPMIYVATGKYFENGDNNYSNTTSTPHVNTVYGLEDNCTDANCTNGTSFNNPTSATGRPTSILVQQQLYTFNGTGAAASTTFRSATANSVNWTTKRGWYEDLVNVPNPPPSTPAASAFQGEKVFKHLITYKQYLIYPTAIPNTTDPCTGVGTSFLMEVCLENGGLCGPVFDVNGDGAVSADETPSAGIMVNGFISEPTILQSTSGLTDSGKFSSVAGGQGSNKLIYIGEGVPTQGVLPKSGRSSWRQLQ